MKTIELRDAEATRTYLFQGLWWQRLMPPSAETVRTALEWSKEIAAAGQPLPPIGFVADVGHAAFSLDGEARGKTLPLPPGLPSPLLRAYEDQVLGKVHADWTFARASDALRRLKGRDRARGLAFLVNQFRERAGIPGVLLSPGAINSALGTPPEEVLRQGWAELELDGPLPLLVELYEALIAGARRSADVLGPEDLPELENGTALQDEGPRLARRQVRSAAMLLEAALPRQQPRPRSHRQEAPTRILDEDTYPVGGFNSISNRGSVESMLFSQLAYMEDERRPDLFDVKFLRDELLYYSRDENRFLRRRRTFVVALCSDLIATRCKDRELPYQRGVMLLALLCVALRQVVNWLSADALAFEIVFIGEDQAHPALGQERTLLESLFPDWIATGTLCCLNASVAELAAHCEGAARRSLCCCLVAGHTPPELAVEEVQVTRLRIDGPRPALANEADAFALLDGDDAVAAWASALEEVLRRWV